MREKTYTLVLMSSQEEFLKLEEFVEKISDEFNIGHTYFSNIIVTLSELVKNAMIHGNNNNPQKKVAVKFTQNEGRLYFSVEDQGKGFPFPLKEASEIPENPNVRNGLSIIHSLSDGLEIENNGSKITVYFDIAAANEILSRSRIQTLKGSHTNETKKKSMHE
jgi:serine/threonine-protein kinase RsbW